ncbi:MAG TPA: hypothetical protein VGL03_00830 [Thermoanaerobaculia bacterium]|jgi:hypothetical protein
MKRILVALWLTAVAFCAACGRKEQAGPASSGQAAPPAAPGGAASAAATSGLVRDSMEVDGQTVDIEHSPFDIGRVQDIFDNDKESLARTVNANPAVVMLHFSKPRSLKRVEVTTATMNVGVKCIATLEGGGEKTFSGEYKNLSPDPTVSLELPGLSRPVSRLRIEIGNLDGGDGHIHIRAIRFS